MAAINSLESITLSGKSAIIEEVFVAIMIDSIFNHQLKTGSNAYYLRHMLAIRRDYVKLVNVGLKQI
jgi:hypothetical protein